MESIGLSAGNFGLLLSLLLGLLFGICLCFASQYIWGRQKHIVLVVIAVIAFAAICMGLFFFISGEKDGFANWMRGMGLFAGAFIAAPFGLYLAHKRTDTLRRQTQNEGKRIISEEFSRSVALLGHDKASVRQGGIYALGRLAKDNEEMHDTIMKIICSFVRGTGGESPMAKSNETDIEAALYVIREREKTQREKTESDFDISNSVLENGDLSEANLAGFNLSDIQATGCIFKGTDFTRANLIGAIFRGGCDFSNAKFDQADVSNADLSMEDSLKQEQVNAMRGNGKTKLPPNVSRPPEWKEWKDN